MYYNIYLIRERDKKILDSAGAKASREFNGGPCRDRELIYNNNNKICLLSSGSKL